MFQGSTRESGMAMSIKVDELLADWKRQHIELSKGADADKAQKEHDKLKLGIPFKRKEWIAERIKKPRWCIFMPEMNNEEN